MHECELEDASLSACGVTYQEKAWQCDTCDCQTKSTDRGSFYCSLGLVSRQLRVVYYREGQGEYALW